jgi:hypothetical protein
MRYMFHLPCFSTRTVRIRNSKVSYTHNRSRDDRVRDEILLNALC